MKHQNTCQNFFNKYEKKYNFESPQTKAVQTKKFKHKRNLSISNKLKISKDSICKEHHLNFEKYCTNCKEDICPICYKNNHYIHETINYEELTLNEKEINVFKEKYDEYIEKYYALMNKIKEWQEILNKNIKDFEEFIQKNIINLLKRMINEYDIENLTYNSIIEYRIAYSLLLENNEDKLSNQKIIKLMKTYKSFKDYENYKYINENQNLSTISFDNIQHYNDLINKGNFEKKGNNIIKLLYNNYSLYSNKKEENLLQKLEKIKQRNNNGPMKLRIKTNKSSTNIFKNSLNNFQRLLDNNIYEKKKIYDKKKNIETHLEKEELPIFNNRGPVQTQYDDDIKDNININSIINAKNSIKKKEKKNEIKTIWKNNKIIFRNNEINNNMDESDDLDLDFDLNFNNIENNKVNPRPIIFNNNINNFNNINNINNKNNYINNYQTENAYSDRVHKSTAFTHKKFSSTLTEFRSTKNIHNLNQSQSENNETDKKESQYNTIDFNNINYETYTNVIDNNYTNNILSNKIFPENENISYKKSKEIEIDIEEDLNIGFELGNTQCRIGIINKALNNIELFQPYDTEDINIPSIISFKDNNDNVILIGKEAEKEKIKNPNYTIFNFVKLIGKYWSEIEGKKDLWPFTLYKSEKTNRPYIKGHRKNIIGNRAFYMEDIFTIFLRNVFEIFFSKIKIKEKKCDLLKINFVISVPNNFTYLQRKLVEKIFLTHLFNNNTTKNKKGENKSNIYYYGKNKIENIQIKNIKIENCSNLGFLYNYQKLSENNKNKNILVINIEGSSVNISLISTFPQTFLKNIRKSENINKYEIKDIKCASFGEEDFTDNFESIYINESQIKEYNKYPTSLAQLRQIIDTTKKNFYKKNQNEIILKNFCDKNEVKISMNKKDFEMSCKAQFDKIVELINDLLKQSSISENKIDDIIFIGNTTSINIIKEKIQNIFKNKNKKLYEKLLENPINENIYDEINPNLIVLGAVIQSYNLFSNKEKTLYKYKEITPISFGIEGINNKIEFMIKKGSQLPIKTNKLIKFKRTNDKKVKINIYEGEEEYSYKNRLISNAEMDIENIENEMKSKDYVEIMIQFLLNQNFELRVFILDSKTSKRKMEFLINIDIVHDNNI